MYVANLLVSFTFMNSEYVWQICEFWILVINICHFDINSCSTGQSTSIFCFDNLLNKDRLYCWQFSCSKLQTFFLCYALLVRYCSGYFNKNPIQSQQVKRHRELLYYSVDFSTNFGHPFLILKFLFRDDRTRDIFKLKNTLLKICSIFTIPGTIFMFLETICFFKVRRWYCMQTKHRICNCCRCGCNIYRQTFWLIGH